MRTTILTTAVAAALLGSTALAAVADQAAQSGAMQQDRTAGQAAAAKTMALSLSADEKQKLRRQLQSEAASTAPPSFEARVGAQVPQAVTLQPVPMSVANEIPALRQFSYVRLANQDIVLVEPASRRIAEVIRQDATTGAGPDASDMPKSESGGTQQ